MTREELGFIENTTDNIRERIICAKDLRPFLRDRTLLYGYTCKGKTFHVYLKNEKIHAVTYFVDYTDRVPTPKDMSVIAIEKNEDYIPDKRLYPEACDYHFCELLKKKGIALPFTGYNEERPKDDFYGFTLDDAKRKE